MLTIVELGFDDILELGSNFLLSFLLEALAEWASIIILAVGRAIPLGAVHSAALSGISPVLEPLGRLYF